jgi:hypothetical protein
MTLEEKIAELINIRDNFNYALTPREVFDDAIEALEQQDKILQILDDCELEAWEILEKIKEVVRV